MEERGYLALKEGKGKGNDGPVTGAIKDLIARQIDLRGIVLWYDPWQIFAGVLDPLDLNAEVVRFRDSSFRLRENIEPFLEYVDSSGGLLLDRLNPRRLLVYVPMDRATTGGALVEAETAGIVVEPTASELGRNSRRGVGMAALLPAKLLYPHEENTKEQLAEILKVAIEGRRRVKEQLRKTDPSSSTRPPSPTATTSRRRSDS